MKFKSRLMVWQWRIENWRDELWRRAAWLMPRKLVYWCVIRAACVHDTYPAERRVIDVLKAW